MNKRLNPAGHCMPVWFQALFPVSNKDDLYVSVQRTRSIWPDVSQMNSRCIMQSIQILDMQLSFRLYLLHLRAHTTATISSHTICNPTLLSRQQLVPVTSQRPIVFSLRCQQLALSFRIDIPTIFKPYPHLSWYINTRLVAEDVSLLDRSLVGSDQVRRLVSLYANTMSCAEKTSEYCRRPSRSVKEAHLNDV
jgi:hypothetical protein